MINDPRTIDRSVNAMVEHPPWLLTDPSERAEFERQMKTEVARMIAMELLEGGHIRFREGSMPPRCRRALAGTVYVMSDAEADTFQKAVNREVDAAITQMANALLHEASNSDGMAPWGIEKMILTVRDKFLVQVTT